MLGSNLSSVGWPACGEIDIMELVGHQPAVTHGTVHWSQDGSHAEFGGSKQLLSGIFNDEFHVFSIIWDETHIEWLLNGLKFHEISTTPQQLSEFHQDYFFIFNVAVGGNWPGYPNQTTEFPQRMIVDYIRVFQ
jgi:beta-glucanase (GH16 family)